MKTPGEIRVKRVYDPVEPGDGTRILVDRLWPRGVSKQAAHMDLWLKDVAPSPALRKWFGHDPARFDEFARRYRAELAADESGVEQLLNLMDSATVTLLYAAHDETHNHAKVLAEYLGARR